MISQFYPYEYADSVFFIDYNKLYNKGFRGIIFDIDNTLVHHGDDSTHEVDELFKEYHPDIVQHLDQKWNSSLFQDLFALLLAYVTSLLYRFV